MAQEATGLKVKVHWKLEKFEGDKTPDSVPVEILEGDDEMTLEQFKEMQNGIDQRRT
jgi:hypothetical protein